MNKDRRRVGVLLVALGGIVAMLALWAGPAAADGHDTTGDAYANSGDGWHDGDKKDGDHDGDKDDGHDGDKGDKKDGHDWDDHDSWTSGGAVAIDGSVASGDAFAAHGSTASGDATAVRGSVASGCSTAIRKSTASGDECPEDRDKDRDKDKDKDGHDKDKDKDGHDKGGIGGGGVGGGALRPAAATSARLALTGSSSTELATLAGLAVAVGALLTLAASERRRTTSRA